MRLVPKPVCGAVTLDQLTVGRCGRIIQGIMRDGSLSKAREARAVLGLICGYALRDDAIPRNPVRDVQRLPMPRTIVSTKKQGLTARTRPSAAGSVDASRCRRWRPRLSGNRLVLAGPGEDAFLFATKTGRPMSVSNYERLLRTFVEDNTAELRVLGVDVDDFESRNCPTVGRLSMRFVRGIVAMPSAVT